MPIDGPVTGGLCVLILAAGAGSRLGGLPEWLIRINGQTLLANQPLLDADDLACAVRADEPRPAGRWVLWPTVGGQPSDLVLFEASVAHPLRNQAHMGLKHWRMNHPATVEAWKTANTHHLQYVDTLQDLQRLQQKTGGHWQPPA